MNELARRVKQLEESTLISEERLNSVQDHPDFTALLQKALLTSAQTDSRDKHMILARLVSERLRTEPETLLALGSKMACDVISFTTINQLMLLGMAVNFYGIRSNSFLPEGVDETNFQEWYDSQLIIKLKPYQNIVLRKIDITHLEALSCLRSIAYVGRNINDLFKIGSLKYNIEKMNDVSLRNAMITAWAGGLRIIDLTTVGQIIGITVSDLLTKTTTPFDGWE